ncbi:MAG TPA: phosphoenolpyruvate--protein phosphotransferase [Chitinivibrionales bacterium]|nr:phosphoenolpyruvate--protein phosphotransferase [Chitinivibrionales bacterium]
MSTLPRLIHGQPASEGVALGTAIVKTGSPDAFTGPLSDAWTARDFENALDKTRKQLAAFQHAIQERVDEQVSQIFGAHLAILDDNEFSGRIRGLITSGMPAGAAVKTVWQEYNAVLSQSASPRIREKTQDLGDLAGRILRNLAGTGAAELSDYSGRILITSRLFPSDILRLVAQSVAGVILTEGGVTAHISVLARSLDLPLVLVDAAELGDIPDGTLLLLEANVGNVHVAPAPDIIAGYRDVLGAKGKAQHRERAAPQTRTADGMRVFLHAAIGLVSEAKLAAAIGSEGVGLYRSEMPFLIRNGFPTEDEQCAVYRKVAEHTGAGGVVFRTLDIGGDKILRYFPTRQETNPFLGLRGIRFTFRHREIFDTQVRAILRAGHDRPVRILFPLVPSVDSFLHAKRIVAEHAAALANAGTAHQHAPSIGAMVELPCAVGIADDLAAEADFLAIGTSDLVQYMLAVDRTNEQMTDWYVPWHPAVLRAIKTVADAGARRDKPVSVCGEIASYEPLIPVLVGMGISHLTIPPRRIPQLQKQIGAINGAKAKELADKMLAARTLAEGAKLIGVEWKAEY